MGSFSFQELHTAEVAYAAIDAVDKLLFMSHVKVRGFGVTLTISRG